VKGTVFIRQDLLQRLNILPFIDTNHS
jgi:hypothetical protein